MKNKQGITPIVIAIIIALVLLVGGGAYITVKNQNHIIKEQSNSNTQTQSNLQTEQPTLPVSNINVQSDDWQIYTNDKFGFQFKYPTGWKVSKEIGDATHKYQEPYLFDTIIETENHPINRAGHISVMSWSLDKFLGQLATLAGKGKIENMNSFETASLQGKKFNLVHPIVTDMFGKTSQQTDYDYILGFGDKTIFVSFISINNSEKQISNDLLVKIDQFVKTFATK